MFLYVPYEQSIRNKKAKYMDDSENPELFDWRSLESHLERCEAMCQAMHDSITRLDLPEDLVALEEAYLSRRNAWRWLRPLVKEMQRRPIVQMLWPLMSLRTIRLFDHYRGEEFAWIDAIEEARFQLSKVKQIGSLRWETQLMREGNSSEIADSLELMVSGRHKHSNE